MLLNTIKQTKLYILICMIIAIIFIIGTNASGYNVTTDFIHHWTAVTGNGGVRGTLPIIKVNQQVAWCLQAEKAIATGSNVLTTFEEIGISKQQETMLSLIANFGYYTQPTDDNYALVQNLIWEYLGFSDYYQSNLYPTKESQQSWKDQVMANVEAYQREVSFHNMDYNIRVGETITINDSNGVLTGLEIVSTDGLQASINGNTLTVTGTIDANDTAVIKLKKPVYNEGINFVVRNGNSQAVSILQTKEANNYWLTFHVNKYIDVNLSKVDSDLGSFVPQGDASLIGAEYGLFSNNDELIGKKVFDTSGIIRFEQLSMNELYYIKEIKAPKGYILSEEIIHINPLQLLDEGQIGNDLQWNVTVKEEVMKQAFSIIKVSSNGDSEEIPTLQGVEFTVKLESEVVDVGWEQAMEYDVLVTDNIGYAVSKELPYGTYIVRETKTPDNLQAARDFTVIINEDNRQPQAYRILNNAPFEAYLELVKKDADTGELITFSEASFQLLDEHGDIVSQKIGQDYIDTFTTDETGSVTTPLKLGPGVYYLHEVKTPKGFVSLEEPIEITINNEGAVPDVDGDPIITIEIYNDRPFGIVEIKKDFEQPNAIEELFATFQVVANIDIINPINGEIVYYEGDILPNPNSEDGLYITDNTLTVTIENLPLSTGKVEYRILEVDTTSQYQLAKDIIVSFEQNDTTTKEYLYSVELTNTLTEVSIRKEDGLTNELLVDAKLQIIDRNGELVSEWISINVPHSIVGLHRDEEYTLREKEAPYGYSLAEDISFVVNDGIIIMKDEPILTNIEIVKIDANTKKVIKDKDFAFTLYADENFTKELSTVNADTSSGTVTLTDIRYGEVFIKERKAPEGYQLSGKSIKVDINDTLENVGNTHTIVFENKASSTIQTVDSTRIIFYVLAGVLTLSGIFYYIFLVKIVKSSK